ncbi:creatininase family protein [[Clostridium] symbiosum]|uniref:creatininase family protein n=1 Tax=Clostridium symbiosum TaxID=1512 RepID=UPI001FAB22CC|nr:creatininase family protein [[Clostridium] symbiosum]
MQYKLRDMSWSEFAQRSKTAKTIILPSGACEVYGPHNPLGADILVAKKMSEMLAERIDGIVGPWMSLRMWKQFPGAGDKSFAGGGNR